MEHLEDSTKVVPTCCLSIQNKILLFKHQDFIQVLFEIVKKLSVIVQVLLKMF